MRLTLSCKNSTPDQIELAVRQLRELGAIAFAEDDRIHVECQNDETQRAVLEALSMVPKIQ